MGPLKSTNALRGLGMRGGGIDDAIQGPEEAEWGKGIEHMLLVASEQGHFN